MCLHQKLHISRFVAIFFPYFSIFLSHIILLFTCSRQYMRKVIEKKQIIFVNCGKRRFLYSIHVFLFKPSNAKERKKKNLSHFRLSLSSSSLSLSSSPSFWPRKKNGFCSIANLLCDFSFYANVLQIMYETITRTKSF